MQHPEPEELALAALGEQLDESTREHVDACEECAAEIASFAATVTVGRTVAPDGSDTLVAPPADVWGRIRDELALSADLEPGEVLVSAPADTVLAQSAVTQGPAATDGPAPDAVPDAVPDAAATAGPGLGSRDAEVHALRDRSGRSSGGSMRRPGVRWITAAAAAGIVVGGAGATLWAGRGSPAPAVIEAAALEALPDWAGATGEAKVEVAADGTRSLVVTLGGATSETGYHEVWLIDTEVTKLVSIGVLDGSTGTFALPPGLDLGEFPVVDISEEHFDGDPAHSGDSIVRGILET